MDALISLFVLADLAQGLGSGVGIISGISMFAVFGGLVGAIVSSLTEKHLGGVKTSLVISGLGALWRAPKSRGSSRLALWLLRLWLRPEFRIPTAE